MDDADAYLPFVSEAGLRAFLVPDLADQMMSYFARYTAGGQVGTACLSAEPITGATSYYKVTDVRVTVADPATVTPDRTSGTVSFRKLRQPGHRAVRSTTDGGGVAHRRPACGRQAVAAGADGAVCGGW